MRRAIVTGATGAVGTALIEELISNNVEVLALCRANSPNNNRISCNKLVSRHSCCLEELANYTNDTGKQFDVFYHLAWAGTIGQKRNDMYLQTQNVKYALDAVAVAQRYGCRTFIGIGSQAEYGRVEGKLYPNTPAFPENGYGMGKLMAGFMTREYSHQLGLRHIWVRILSVYGPNDNPNSLVMSLITKLKNGEVPQMTKGEQLWDYLYSGDAAKALYLIGEKGLDGKTYVLGSGQARPLREYAEIIRKIVNPYISINYGAIPYSDMQVMHLCADISELINDTGWKPEIAFEEHIQRLIT